MNLEQRIEEESIAADKRLRDTALERDISLAEKLTDGINQKDAELGRLRAAPSTTINWR